MNLIKKSIIIIISSMLLLMVLAFILLQSFMLNVYVELEEKALQDKIYIIRRSMEEQITYVSNMTKDWAYWDDTYRFAKDRNEAYVLSNLSESALSNIDMNFIVIKDKADKIILAKRYDLEEKTFLDFSEEEIRFMQEDIALEDENRSGKSGLVLLEEGIAVLSFEPILMSNEEGQSNGILVMGKYIDNYQADRLSQKIQSQVGFINVYDIKNDQPLSSIIEELHEKDQVIDYVNESMLHGYAMMDDMHDKPLLLLDISMERDVYLKGKYNIYIFYCMFFIIGVVFTGLIIFIIKNIILIRIGNLKKEVGKIAEHKDLSKRVYASGNDEITELTADINKMLQSLEQAQQKIKYLGFHDNLTGLYNRSFFNVELKRLEHTRFLPVAIITGDVNGLKLINDAFGLEAGDNVLKKIAEILIESCRKEDIIARVSGNEFAMILPSTSYADAMQISARIKDRIKSDSVENIHPSISLGIAAKNEKEEKIGDVFKQATDNMYKAKLLESKSFRSSIIASLIKTLSEGTAETEEHSQRLKKYSLLIGKKMSLNESQLDDLALISVLHDIGKTAIPENILNKKGSLNAQEWEKMKEHSEIGYRIASSLPELASVSDAILYHHEHWDGTGYPHGLKGSRIPLLARIISIVDAFDAMTNDRVYSKAMPLEDAIMELDINAGKQFDPILVKMFLHIIDEENLVKLA
jgi:diguanylate cyclase (GGDEF)-like protein